VARHNRPIVKARSAHPHRRARADVDDAVQLATSGGANLGRDVLDVQKNRVLLARVREAARREKERITVGTTGGILVWDLLVEDAGPEPAHARGLRNLLEQC